MKTDQKSVRLFKSDAMENLTHVPVWLPATIWIPVIAYFIYQTAAQGMLSGMDWLVTASAALLFWSVTEYSLHRFLFHAKFNHPRLRRMVFLLHGVHHDYPNDAERLLMPPLAAIPIASIFFGLFWIFLGPAYTPLFFAFFLIGYLIYDYIHFATHHFRAKSTVLAILKKNHMAHHYIDPERYYGVSSPLWDVVMGTFED